MNIMLTLGNFICLCGTLLLIRAVIKDRMILRGYSLAGAVFTFTSLVFFCIAFYKLNEIVSVVFAIPTVTYWFLVVLFKSLYESKTSCLERATLGMDG